MATNDDLVVVGKGIQANIGALVSAFTTFFGVSGTAGSLTLSAAASTVVANATVTASSFIFLFPTNASAASLVAGTSSPYISAKSASVSFTVATADGGSAAGTETFNYLIVNLV